MVRPLTTTLVADPGAVAVIPPGDEVAVYPVIGLPPLSPGAVQLTVADALPRTAVTFVGAPGTVAGVTELEGAEGGPVPTVLAAVTVKV